MTETPLLEVHNLTKTFFGRHHRKLLAVDNVSFAIHRGESFGLVGESGCGNCEERSVKKKVLIVYTGGTIGMLRTPNGYAPKDGYCNHYREELTKEG